MTKYCWWSATLLAATTAFSQSLGNYGAVRGVMVDTSKASIPSAIVTLRSESTGMERILTVDSHGGFQWNGLPFGAYRLTATARGFADASLELAIRSSVPLEADLPLSIAGSSSSLEVSDKITGVLEVSPTARGTLDRSRLEEIPVQNPATGMSDMVTRTTPGVAADGNGFAHPLGEHADTSFSIDNQPITDQQAKVFSNQISTDIIDIMEVTTGAPAAEFGGKTSLIITVTTRSGLGKAKPFGSISSQYGSFGSWSEGITTGAGNSRLGNFTAISSGGSGRFLDTPEFRPLHDKGNSQALFNRADWQPNSATGLHLNLSAARSWFQTPNTYDSQTAGQDQRSQIRSFNIAPSFSRLLNPQTLFTLNLFLRFDRSQYFPSANPFVDRPATLSQSRYLTNTGFRTDLAWSRGLHNAKIGGSYWHTLLREAFTIAVTDPAFNSPCLECEPARYRPNPDFIPNLQAYDLTRGGHPYAFNGNADVEEGAFYVQDTITFRNLTLNPGLRYDRYNGLSRGHLLQPRFGMAYRIPFTGTVARLSWARLYETPYNENLIIATQAAARPEAGNPFGTFRSSAPKPGTRDQFNAGLAQSLGSHLSLDADYFWKFTINAFDFDSLFLTPITFPIGLRQSKIDGLAARIILRPILGFSASAVLGHTRSRFFGPQTGGLVFNDTPDNGVFRIDHSEEFQHTTQLRYQPRATAPWATLSWRYNSGLALPGVAPDYASAFALTGDEQAQMGLYCGPVFATVTRPITTCPFAEVGATRVSIPPPGTHNDDLRPTRVAARNVVDLGFGLDNLLRRDRYKVQLRFTVLNITGTSALYNFLSTFSGTHFLTPRTVQSEVRLVF